MIDHGFFHIDSVVIGIWIWSFVALLKKKNIICTMLFILGMNVKVHAIYYFFPVFAYLMKNINDKW